MTDLAALSSLDDPVRRRLYEVVRERTEPVGRDEAAAAAGVGRALAVYHLDKLVEAGLLTASYQRPPGRSGPGAGRPAKVYTRSDREFAVTVPPREYELAARLLVQAVEARVVTAGPPWSRPRGGSAPGRRAVPPSRLGSVRGRGSVAGLASRAAVARPGWSGRAEWGRGSTKRWPGTDMSRGAAMMASSGCGTARSISWPSNTGTWCAA